MTARDQRIGRLLAHDPEVTNRLIQQGIYTKSPYISVKFLVWWFEIWDSLTWPERENPWMRSERHLWWPGCSAPNLPVPGANGF